MLANPGPFIVKHGKPGRVAVSFTHDAVLAKDTFRAKAESARRRLRAGVERVTFPFYSTITQLFESVSQQQEDALRIDGAALHLWDIPDVPHLDAAVFGSDAQIADDPNGLRVCVGFDDEEAWIF